MGDRRTPAAAEAIAASRGSNSRTSAIGDCAVEIAGDVDGWAEIVTAERLTEFATRALRRGPERATSVAIVLSCDDEIRDLNRRFCGKDRPTNVLSFPALSAPGGPAHLGDVFLARETIEREAAELAILVTDHACHLCVHGVLHLLGYEHDDDGSAHIMESLETAILSEFGIADPYGEEPAALAGPIQNNSHNNV